MKIVIVWIVAPDALSGERENRTGGSNIRFTGDSVDDIYLFVYKQACVAMTSSHTTEVSGLKQSLERAEEELGRVKKQLEDKQGKSKP